MRVSSATLLLCCWLSSDAFVRRDHNRQSRRRLPTSLSISVTPPSNANSISSPVLLNVYSALVEHNQTHGHPNIPLGSAEGRACDVLRRLAIQGKLTEPELELLKELTFRFHSLEDVYSHVDFDELLQRLLDYEATHGDNYQVPKKHVPDPELGAWVTGLRRLGAEGVSVEHAERLNAVGFSWKSARQCGSAFMSQYRELVAADPSVLTEPKTMLWKKAQMVARTSGKLSDTRYHYMEQLFGVGWDTPDED